MSCALTSNADYPNYLKSILKEIEIGNDKQLKTYACQLKAPITNQGCPIVDNNGKVGAFPFCWTTIGDGSLVGPGTLYPVGFSLGQVMELYWKSKKFKHEIGSFTSALLGMCTQIGCCGSTPCPCLQRCNPIRYKRYRNQECFRHFAFSQEELVRKLSMEKLSNSELIKRIMFNKKEITLYYKNIEYYRRYEDLIVTATAGECECINENTGEIIFYHPLVVRCNKTNQPLTNNIGGYLDVDHQSVQIDFFRTYCVENCGQEPENPPIYSPQYILKEDDTYTFYPTIRIHFQDTTTHPDTSSFYPSAKWTSIIPSELNGEEILQTSTVTFRIHGHKKDINIYNIGHKQSEYTCGFDTGHRDNPLQPAPFKDPIFIN